MVPAPRLARPMQHRVEGRPAALASSCCFGQASQGSYASPRGCSGDCKPCKREGSGCWGLEARPSQHWLGRAFHQLGVANPAEPGPGESTGKKMLSCQKCHQSVKNFIICKLHCRARFLCSLSDLAVCTL